MIRICLFPLVSLLAAANALHAQENDKSWLVESHALFATKQSMHFEAHYFPTGSAAAAIDDILKSREAGYVAVSNFLNIDFPTKIKLYFFPDQETKRKVTGHGGYGWGFDNVIAEVYNDSIQVDPFHELTHVLAYQIAHPPAALDEGLAVYLSEKFGNSAFFELVGYPGSTINETLHILLKDKKPIALRALLAYEDISAASEVVLAYVQSASLVKFLIETHGREKFLKLFAAAKPNGIAATGELFVRLYQGDLSKVEQQWLVSLRISK